MQVEGFLDYGLGTRAILVGAGQQGLITDIALDLVAHTEATP